MTDKERADVLRKAADIMATEWDKEQCDYMREYADGLDPLRPEPGTVVRWRHKGTTKWSIGTVAENYDGIVDTRRLYEKFGNIEWKPAQILAPGEVVIPIKTASTILGEYSHYNISTGTVFATYARAELQKAFYLATAERMEVEG